MKKLIYLLITSSIITLSILGIKIFNTKDTVLINKLEKIRYSFNNKKNYYLDLNNYIENDKILDNHDYFNSLTKDEKIELFERFVNTNINYKLKAKKIQIIKDINNSQFYLVNFKPLGYAVFKYETLEGVEVNYNKNLYINPNNYKYAPLGEFEYKNIVNYGYNLNLNKSIDTSIRLMKKFNKGSNDNDDKYLIKDLNYRADIEVPYSWFFRYNRQHFPHDYWDTEKYWKNEDVNIDAGLCEYVALALLMSYNEFFISSGYFDDEDIERYFTINNGNTYEEVIPTLNVNIIKDLFYLNKKAVNITAHNLRKLLSDFEKSRYDDYYTKFAYGFTADPYSVIVEGIPTMISYISGYKEGHNVVAYGYDTEKSMYLVHKGFKDETQGLYSRSFWNFLYDFSIRDNKKENKTLRKMFNVNGKFMEGTKVNL